MVIGVRCRPPIVSRNLRKRATNSKRARNAHGAIQYAYIFITIISRLDNKTTLLRVHTRRNCEQIARHVRQFYYNPSTASVLVLPRRIKLYRRPRTVTLAPHTGGVVAAAAAVELQYYSPVGDSSSTIFSASKKPERNERAARNSRGTRYA